MKIYTKIEDRKPLEIAEGVFIDFGSRTIQKTGGGIYLPYFFSNSDNCPEFKDELFKFLERWYPDYIKNWKSTYRSTDKEGFWSIPELGN